MCYTYLCAHVCITVVFLCWQAICGHFCATLICVSCVHICITNSLFMLAWNYALPMLHVAQPLGYTMTIFSHLTSCKGIGTISPMILMTDMLLSSQSTLRQTFWMILRHSPSQMFSLMFFVLTWHLMILIIQHRIKPSSIHFQTNGGRQRASQWIPSRVISALES